MKALSIASIIAIGLAGAACSQAASSADETTEVETQADTTTADTGGSFNLGLPTDVDSAGTASDSSFNLDLPSGGASSTDGFNLGTDIQASGGLSDIPEIDTSIAEEEAEVVPEVDVDDEPVIRLD